MKKRITQSKFYFIGLILLIMAGFLPAAAQVTDEQKADTLTPAVEQVKSDLTVLKRLKISGYIQAQWQKAEQAGIPSFAGGSFPADVDNRFSVRRGRVKFTYDNDWSQYVLQFDVTEKGVGIKDAYASFTDPWTKYFTLTGGVFNRPFGYEIVYSSNMRESPERSRFVQTLFPGERDLGAKLTIQPPKTSRYNFISLDLALINGTGNTAVDFDKYKDFIGRLAIVKSNKKENIKYGIGISYYYGGWKQGTKYNYAMKDVTLKEGGTMKAFVVDSTSSAPGDKLKREYFGIDAQFAFDFSFGMTQIRGEYIIGTQPGTSSTTTSATAQPTQNPAVPYATTAIYDTTGGITGYTTVANAAMNSDAYSRKFNGFYFYLVQNIFQTRHQFIFKYDWYDPNTDIAGNDIGANAKSLPKGARPTSSTDIKYSTIGIGWAFRWNSNVKLTAYYDIVKNESTSAITNKSPLKDFASDMKDNVFTLRLQYKF
jgi:hypothetical protein